MNCFEGKAEISEFLDGELADSNSLAMKEHLKTCSDCQRLADEFLSLKFDIEQALNSIPIPLYLEERILISIHLEHKAANKQAWVTGLFLIVLGIPILALFSPILLSSLRLFNKTLSVFIHTWLTLLTIAVQPSLGLGITLMLAIIAGLGVYSLRALLKGFQADEVLS
ncbi:MAG TPA: hypothetical protein DD730_03540 [Desulfosporosinus sp.]|jgi:predicted anti-sigma-YlaC factor YlaD|nr:hypothetical protein [Desulfosporosinus sp.]